MNPKYYELVDALVGMATQYLMKLDGELDNDCVSAGEICMYKLSQLGLLKDNTIILEAYDNDYLKRKFGGIKEER